MQQELRKPFHEHYAPVLAKHFIVYSADSGHPLHHKGFGSFKETPVNAAQSSNGWNHNDMRVRVSFVTMRDFTKMRSGLQWALEKHGQNNNKFAFKNVHTGEYLMQVKRGSDHLKMGHVPEHFTLLHAHSHGNYHLFKIVHGEDDTRYLTAHHDGGKVSDRS